ncbi:uncharacterized protein LOC143445889 isoform X1 [Clavelina lepadiformis]|uniref:uncharacterized protein LOC143445889 isoform X1 n=1 Tax=Clavelina lepadiformis TaxID=159417 RepID=UPI0040434975
MKVFILIIPFLVVLGANAQDWGRWKPDGQCSVTCGGGMKKEKRVCKKNVFLCRGSRTRKVPCNTQSCIALADVGWTTWETKGTCSASCGGGTVTQTRECQNANGCRGKRRKKVKCNTATCSEASWSEWAKFESCSASCGGGKLKETRSCQNGSSCSGKSKRSVKCNTQPCQSEWGEWQTVGICSATCESGRVGQTRECLIGYDCVGVRLRTIPCNTQQCPSWSSWADDGDCSATCGGGTKTWTRTCSSRYACEGGSTKLAPCLTQACPTWGPWIKDGQCSATCGGGAMKQTRTCISGPGCEGQHSRTVPCQTRNCPKPMYGEWSSCSRTCGWGTRTKKRVGLMPKYEDCKYKDCQQETCTSPLFKRYKDRSHQCCNASSLTTGSCGVNAMLEGRVVNGENAKRKAWPWMVYVNPSNFTLCGGSLIRRDLVLTVAHCVNQVDVKGIRMRLGALTLGDTSEHVQHVRADKVFIHPRYNFPAYDIAIVKLATAANLNSDYVRNICLPRGETVPDDVMCFAIGWGLTSVPGYLANTLQEVALRTIPFEVCQVGYPRTNATGKLKEENMICAGKIAGGVDTCNGDSGGPLMCQRCSSCAWMVAGITSFGHKQCSKADSPGIYTRVSFFQDWINEVAREDVASGDYPTCQ